MGGIEEGRHRAGVDRVDGHSGGVSSVPEDKLNGVVLGGQRQVAGQLGSTADHRLDLAKNCAC